MKDPEPYSHDSMCCLLRFIVYTQPKQEGEVVVSPDGYATIEWHLGHGTVCIVFEGHSNIECYCSHGKQHAIKRFDSSGEVVDFIKASGFKDTLF